MWAHAALGRLGVGRRARSRFAWDRLALDREARAIDVELGLCADDDIRSFAEAAAIAQDLGNTTLEALAVVNLALAERVAGDLSQSREHVARAASLVRSRAAPT